MSEQRVGPGAVLQSLISLAAPPKTPLQSPTLSERAGPRGPRVDIYLPPGEAHGGLLFVHGGAFLIGSRAMKPARFIAGALAESGLAVASCDYRTFPRARLRGAREDVERSLAWWCEQEGRFGLERQSLMGLSAGGALALLASATPPRPLERVVAVFALYDLGALAGRLPGLLGRALVGGSRGDWSAASPAGAPLGPAPLTILHGDADRLTPLPQAEAYAARRAAAGLETELIVSPGAAHGFFNDATSAVAQQGLADLRRVLGRQPERARA